MTRARPSTVAEPAQRGARRINDVEYIDSVEALAMLGVRRATFYTYVSRGLVRTLAQVGSKTKLYRKSDVQRLRSRATVRNGGPRVSQSLRYGEPIAQTWICEITPAGPSYRGALAVGLAAASRPFEAVAERLWSDRAHALRIPWTAPRFDPVLAGLLRSVAGQGRGGSVLRPLGLVCAHFSNFEQAGLGPRREPTAEGRRLLQAFAGTAGLIGPARAFAPPLRGELLAERLAANLGHGDARETAAAINAALVLSAEHELAPPTFIARICASTGADLFACVASAILAQSGPMQVGGCSEVEALLDLLTRPAPRGGRGRQGRLEAGAAELPCFSHPLYDRDPRAEALIGTVRGLAAPAAGTDAVLDFIEDARPRGAHPNIFAAMAVLCRALGLPRGSAALLHTLARTAGWVAHVMEQRVAGTMLRPRAKYMGVTPPG